VSVDDIKTFHNQDAEYVDWVDQHGGYVLTNYTRGEGYSLHAAGCKHLGPYGSSNAKTTKKPRRWAASAHPLRRWALERSDVDVHECQLCMHTSTGGRRRRRW
jgi:hypothetical protein